MIRTLSAIALLAAAAPPATAQSIAPATPYYAMDPARPLSPSAQSPVQQQILQNYRSQLQATRRDLAQRNPSAVAPGQLDVTSRLNALTVPSAPLPLSGSTAPPATAFNPAPFAATGPIAAPPFNAAPPPAAGGISR